MAELLWGHRAKFSYLLVAAFILIFAALGAREIWTQEHRWADIVSMMFYRQDFLHPYLRVESYYDKPLLSYWFVIFAIKLIGTFDTWALRLPSAIAGLLAIYSIYSLGTQLKNKQFGLLSGWMLLTTYYFLFWSRISSADMLNLAGILFAINWYWLKRNSATWFDYSIFFLIVSLTCLCKGLIGAVVPSVAIFIDVMLNRRWQKHLQLSLLIGFSVGLLFYFLPFFASQLNGIEQFEQNGLYQVYRENVLRYFQPFDHKEPFYIYFIYLPLYLLPWSILLIPALISFFKRWPTLTNNSRWIMWTLVYLFVFLSLSGSRRSYYVLPLVPFGILFVADWVMAKQWMQKKLLSISILSLFFIFLIGANLLPGIYYSIYGVERFAITVKKEATKIKAWEKWKFILLDGETTLSFYLHLPPDLNTHPMRKTRRILPNFDYIQRSLPYITYKSPETIFITRKRYVKRLKPYFKEYRLLEVKHLWAPSLEARKDLPVAFIPPNYCKRIYYSTEKEYYDIASIDLNRMKLT